MDEQNAVSVNNTEIVPDENSSPNEKEIISNYYNDIISGNSSFARRAASFDPAEASRQAPFVPPASITRMPNMPMASLTSYGNNLGAAESTVPYADTVSRTSYAPAGKAEEFQGKASDDLGLSALEALVDSSSENKDNASEHHRTSNDDLISSITSSIDELLSQMDFISAKKRPAEASDESVIEEKSVEANPDHAESGNIVNTTNAADIYSKDSKIDSVVFPISSDQDEDKSGSDISIPDQTNINEEYVTVSIPEIIVSEPSDTAVTDFETDTTSDDSENEIGNILAMLGNMDPSSITESETTGNTGDSTELSDFSVPEITTDEQSPSDTDFDAISVSVVKSDFDANNLESDTYLPEKNETVPDTVTFGNISSSESLDQGYSDNYIPVSTTGFDFTDISFFSDESENSDNNTDDSLSSEDLSVNEPAHEAEESVILPDTSSDAEAEQDTVEDTAFEIIESNKDLTEIIKDTESETDSNPQETMPQEFETSLNEFIPSLFNFPDEDDSGNDFLSSQDNDPEFLNILAELESADETVPSAPGVFSFDVSEIQYEEPDETVLSDAALASAEESADQIIIPDDKSDFDGNQPEIIFAEPDSDIIPSSEDQPLPDDFFNVIISDVSDNELSILPDATDITDIDFSNEGLSESSDELSAAFETESHSNIVNEKPDTPEQYDFSGPETDVTPLFSDNADVIDSPEKESDISFDSSDTSEEENKDDTLVFFGTEAESISDTENTTEDPVLFEEVSFDTVKPEGTEIIPTETAENEPEEKIMADSSVIFEKISSVTSDSDNSETVPTELSEVEAKPENEIPVDYSEIPEEISFEIPSDIDEAKTEETIPGEIEKSGLSAESSESFTSEKAPEYSDVIDISETEEVNAFPKISQETGTFVVPFDGTMEFNAVEPKQHSETTLFDISDQLFAATIAKDYNKTYSDNNLAPEGKETLLSVKKADSIYYISRNGGTPYRICENLSFDLKSGSICALISDVRLAAYVTAREIAERCEKASDESVRVFGAGEKAGMLYIGSDSSLPREITLKNYLTSICSGEDRNTVNQRVGLIISQLGLGNLENTALFDISPCKRILILMTAAALNDSVKCVIVNDPSFKVTMEDDMLARRVCELLNSNGKCVLLSCCSDLMISSVCNRLLVMKDGQELYFGSFVNFVDNNCLKLLSCKSSDTDATADMLASGYPNINCEVDGENIRLSLNPDDGRIDMEQLVNDLVISGEVDSSSISVDIKSFISAKKEVYSR